MYINISLHAFWFIYNCFKLKLLTQRWIGWLSCIDCWLMIFQIAFSIWGCYIMYGEEYNLNMLWSKDDKNYSAYRVCFELMVIIRLIGLICCGYTSTCFCLCGCYVATFAS